MIKINGKISFVMTSLSKVLKTIFIFFSIFHYSYGEDIDISEKKYLLDECNNDNNYTSCYKFARFYGLCIYNGACSEEYFKVTIKPYTKACNANIALACAFLAGDYLIGRGINKDHKKAIMLYKKACKLNEPYGCSNMGMIKDIKQDYEASYKYYAKACKLSNYYCNKKDELKFKLLMNKKIDVNTSEE